jgi:hypothetical protein
MGHISSTTQAAPWGGLLAWLGRSHARCAELGAMRTLICVVAVFLAVTLHAETVTVQPTLSPALRDSFRLAAGTWEFRGGEFEQTNTRRLAAAILTEPALSDTRLSVDFRIHPEGAGVRAAAPPGQQVPQCHPDTLDPA